MDGWYKRYWHHVLLERLEIQAKARVLDTNRKDLIIDGVPMETRFKDLDRLQEDYTVTWMVRDLPLEDRVIDSWLPGRGRLATSPILLSNRTMLQWTDGNGVVHRAQASSVQPEVTEVRNKSRIICTGCRCLGGSTCGNPFSNMERILGRSDSPLKVHDCFVQWLSERGYTARPQPQDVDMKFIFDLVHREMWMSARDKDLVLKACDERWE